MLGSSDGIDSFTEDLPRNNPFLVHGGYVKSDEQMADIIEEPAGGVVADGGLTAAAGADTRARFRHRMFAGDRDSNGVVRRGGSYVWVERTSDSSS